MHPYILLICLMPSDVIIQLYAVKNGYVWLCMVMYGAVTGFLRQFIILKPPYNLPGLRPATAYSHEIHGKMTTPGASGV